MDFEAAFNHLLRPWKRRIQLMIGRAIIHSIKDDGGRIKLKVSGLDGEDFDDVELFQEYGHASNPPAGTEMIVAAIGGERGHAAAIGTENKEYRPDLGKAESATYTWENAKPGGHILHLLAGQKMEARCKEFVINTGTSKIIVNGGGITLIGPTIAFKKE